MAPKSKSQSTQDAMRAELMRLALERLSRIVLLDHTKCKPNTPAFDYLVRISLVRTLLVRTPSPSV